MINQYLKLNTFVNVYNLVLWLIEIVITFSIASYILIKFFKKQDKFDKIQKENVFTWFLLFFMLSIANTLNILWRFVVIDTEDALLINRISVLLCFSFMMIKTINIERGINRSNLYRGYYFTVISLISLIFFVLSYFYTLSIGITTIIFIIISIGWSLLPIIFLYLAIKTIGESRKNSLKVFIGSIVLIGAMLLQPQNINFLSNWENYELLFSISMFLDPIIIIFGTLVIFSGAKYSM